MAVLGQQNILHVLREAPPGLYLDANELGEVLLPGRYIPKGTESGDKLKVFLYRDSEDRLVATTETPFAMVGDFALLRVVSVSRTIGAFLDWGLSKDLLLPMAEQETPVRAGQWVVVHVFHDERSDRIVASTKLDDFLDRTEPLYDDGQPVNLLIAGETPLGFKAIVENAHWGLLYRNELPEPLRIGQSLKGFVKTIREDGKIDLSLDASGYQRVAPLSQEILAALKNAGGEMAIGDKSPPEEIRATFGVSKKAFKQALGALLRERRIEFTETGVKLSDPGAWQPSRRK